MALADQIAAYWKFDETSGDAVEQVNANNGVNTGVTYTTGALNNAAQFDAATDVLYVGNPTAVNITGSQVWSFWVKAAAQTGLRSFMFKGGVNSAADMNFGLMKYSGADLHFWASSGSALSTISITQANANTWLLNDVWHHVMIEYVAGTSMAIYIDNVVRASSSSSIIGSISTSKGLSFGRITLTQSANARDSFIGLLDEACIIGGTITSDERATLYNSGTPPSYEDLIGGGGGGGYRFVPQIRPFAGL
jgi:hypothetical protein